MSAMQLISAMARTTRHRSSATPAMRLEDRAKTKTKSTSNFPVKRRLMRALSRSYVHGAAEEVPSQPLIGGEPGDAGGEVDEEDEEVGDVECLLEAQKDEPATGRAPAGGGLGADLLEEGVEGGGVDGDADEEEDGEDARLHKVCGQRRRRRPHTRFRRVRNILPVHRSIRK